MVVVMEERATEAQIEKVVANLVEQGMDVHRSTGVTRTVLGAPRRTPSVARLGPGNACHRAVFARSYRVDSRGLAVMLIEEWFLADLGELIVRPGWRSVLS